MYHIKNDKRTITTTQLISNALTSLILENQWEKLTITALVNRAQVGRATFYRNFDLVEDVLKFQIDKAMEEMFNYIYSEIMHLPHFHEIDLYYHFFKYWDQHDILLKVLIMSNQLSLFKNQLNSLYLLKLSFVQKNLNIKDEHWSYFVILRSAILSDGLFEWIQKGKKESPEDISKILLLSFSELHLVKLTLQK